MACISISSNNLCIVRSDFANAIKDACSHPKVSFDSDHFPVIAKFKIKFRANPKRTFDKFDLDYSDARERMAFNASLKEKWHTIDKTNYHQVVGLLKNTALNHFNPKPPKQKKPWISKATWDKIDK